MDDMTHADHAVLSAASKAKPDVSVSCINIDRNCGFCQSPRGKAQYRVDAATGCVYYKCGSCGYVNTVIENEAPPSPHALEGTGAEPPNTGTFIPAGVKTLSTGAVRTTDADNTSYTLISPIGLRRLAETYKEGSKKYGDYNWEKGMSVREMLEHSIRHHMLYLAGDREEDHLAHAAWNLFGAMHSEEKWPHLNQGQLREAQCEPPSQSCCSSPPALSTPTNTIGR